MLNRETGGKYFMYYFKRALSVVFLGVTTSNLLEENNKKEQRIRELQKELTQRTTQVNRLESILNSVQARISSRPRFNND